MISVLNYDILTKLPKDHLKNKEIAETTEDNKKWTYNKKRDKWYEYKTTSSSNNIQMSLYDINKQLIAQLPPMEDIDKQKEIIQNFKEKYNNDSSHFMLLCREIYYFTIFEQSSTSTELLENLVLECINDIGIIQDIEYTEDNSAIEIWVKTSSEELLCMYFFNYDKGVVYYN